ncbi:MAG: NAD(P)H-binding protein, partial [Gemmatimonadetes bacterium]|nr:NAD(P)H-binding protein [Gemmatimonadota bacterium]
MKALVTGATGFIGSALVQRLIDESFHVRALVRPASDASSLETLGVEIARGDIRNRDDVERTVADCQLVFHLAKPSQGDPSPTETNATGVANVAHAAVQAGVKRIVFA